MKDPNNIDEAVFQVVSFQETKQTAGKVYDTSRSVRDISSNNTDSDSESDDLRVARSLPGKNKNRIFKHDESSKNSPDTVKGNAQQNFDLTQLRDIIRDELKSVQQTQAPTGHTSYSEQVTQHPYRQQGYRSIFSGQGQYQNRSYNYGRNRACFYCHDPSHIKRNCPKLASNNANKTNQAPIEPVANPSGSANSSNQPLN